MRSLQHRAQTIADPAQAMTGKAESVFVGRVRHRNALAEFELLHGQTRASAGRRASR